MAKLQLIGVSRIPTVANPSGWEPIGLAPKLHSIVTVTFDGQPKPVAGRWMGFNGGYEGDPYEVVIETTDGRVVGRYDAITELEVHVDGRDKWWFDA